MAANIATEEEIQVASEISGYLSEQAAKLPVSSQLRALALQSSGHWATIAGQERRRLMSVEELQRQGLIQ